MIKNYKTRLVNWREKKNITYVSWDETEKSNSFIRVWKSVDPHTICWKQVKDE